MNSSNRILTRTDSDPKEDRTSVILAQSPPPWVDAAAAPRRSGIAPYLEVPFMNKGLICFCCLIGLLVGWAAILLWPRTYASIAKLMIKVGRESVSLDPTATTGSTLMMLQKTQEEEITSALEVLNSRHMAEKIVESIGADAIMAGHLPQEGQVEAAPAEQPKTMMDKAKAWAGVAKGTLGDVLLDAGVKDDISNHELAVMRVQGSVDIHSPKKSSVIIIEGMAETPELAQAIVKEVTETFLDEHLKGAFTEGSHEFFTEQSKEVGEQLTVLIADRAKYMQEHKIISIDANRDLLNSQLSAIDRDLALAEGQLEQALAEVEDVKAKYESAPDEVVAEKIEAGDETWSGMRQQVYELELEEQNLAANFTEEHPRLRRVRTQLKGAKAILAELQSERVDESTTINPVKTRLGESLQQKQTLVVGLRSMIKEKEQQRDEMEALAEELLEHERHLTKVDRDIRLKESNLKNLREKLEEARVIDELHSERISNVHVFQPATFVERAVKPQKKILGAGFLFLGLMTGLGLSFLRQGSSPSLRTADDVEQRLGTPVVSSIPRMKQMRSPRLRDQKAYRKQCQALMAEILMSQHRPGQKRGRSLGIIGVDVGAGASTLAVNLAVASSVDCHLKTVLVDADSRKRSVSKMFGLNGAPGLVELVSGSASHDECLQKVKKTEIDLIASSADTCPDILSNSAPEIVAALQAYLDDCDLLIIDLPAASQPDQAVALAQHLDCIVIVAESEKTQTVAAERLLRRLTDSNTEVIGVVLNKTKSYLPKWLRRCVAPEA